MARPNYNYLTYEPLKVNLGAAPDWMFNSKWSTFDDAAQEVAKTQMAQSQAKMSEFQVADAEREQRVVENLKAKYSENAPTDLNQMLDDLLGASVQAGDYKTAISAAGQKRQYEKALADAEQAMKPKVQRYGNGAQWEVDPVTGEAKFVPGPEKPKQATARSRMMIFETPEGGYKVGNLYDKTTQDELAASKIRPMKQAQDTLSALMGLGQDQPTAEEAPGLFARMFGGAEAQRHSNVQQPSGDPTDAKAAAIAELRKRGRIK